MNITYVHLGGTITSITDVPFELRCRIPTAEDGKAVDKKGDPLPLAQRPFRCNHPTIILVGEAPTCDHHMKEVAVIGDAAYERLMAGHRWIACPYCPCDWKCHKERNPCSLSCTAHDDRGIR